MNLDETIIVPRNREKQSVAQTVQEVCQALNEKGYNAIDQLTGYLLSGDPTYITSYKEARTKLRRHERYELIEEMVKNYLQHME